MVVGKPSRAAVDEIERRLGVPSEEIAVVGDDLYLDVALGHLGGSRTVLVRSGIVARTGRDVPLSRINDITFSHSILERFLGCGTLVVESAGERGQVTLTDVPKVERVQRQLYDLVERTDARLRGNRDPSTDPPAVTAE